MADENLLKKLEEARKKYKPEKIKIIFIAEAPPDSLDRFFYYENVKKADYLFLGIIDALYPNLKESFLKSKRTPEIKQKILSQFKRDGFYLLDLYELPISMKFESKINARKKLSEKLKKICNKETSIILIKKDVYDNVYDFLKSNFNVINKKINFPSNGWQKKFKEKFTEALKIVNHQSKI